MTWKQTSNRPLNKFSPENINYCQDFLDYMSTVDPCKIKCFDEAGFKMPDVVNPNYGHSAVGEPCIEVKRYINAPNVTLQVLAGIGHCRNVRGLGKSMVVFRLFEKLRYSNERSTKFENIYQE